MDVLAGWTAHVQVRSGLVAGARRGRRQRSLRGCALRQQLLPSVVPPGLLPMQAHYKQAAAERQAQLRRRHGADAAALARDEAALQAAQEAGVRGELGTFVEQV